MNITPSQKPLFTRHYDTLIIGSGAAGFSAAERLYDLGHKNIAVVTEHINAGTSRNTGSDKQTYYKLTLSGNRPDSILSMTETLFSGGCVDGDLALCEAALSTRCFFHLTEAGVPFPCNRYGEYIGYKTDHDPYERATSAGPYTSKMMTEALEKYVRNRNIPILNHMQVIRILVYQNQVRGVLCLNLDSRDQADTSLFEVYTCQNLIYATGGPAGMYFNSVYPHGHHGSTGLAFEAGAAGQNLTEWQYGLASLHPRWNVSGTYMQALPRFISTTEDGLDEREFLCDYFQDKQELLNKIFLKGYQWPFDVKKIRGGSSIIDILVHVETQKGRRVYLDYTKNPCNGIDFDLLPDESRLYLKKGQACFGTPYERLVQMNEPAAAFYREKGIDLAKKPLEIALCAQHNNGGLAVNAWWQTSIAGLFCIGEACGSHGIYRPGGTALNAGQVGALRAAQYIAASPEQTANSASDPETLQSQIEEIIRMAEKVTVPSKPENVTNITQKFQKRMSHAGAAFRDIQEMDDLLQNVTSLLGSLAETCHVQNVRQLKDFFQLRDILLCQQAYLTAMIDYAKSGNHSRGSAVYLEKDGKEIHPLLPDTYRFVEEPDNAFHMIQEITCSKGITDIHWRAPRPVPEMDSFFENVWKRYRVDRNIY